MSNSTPTPAAHRLGLVGRKVGMTRIFTEEGESIPVTVLDVSNNRVTQVKSRKPTATPRSRWLMALVVPRVWLSRKRATTPKPALKPVASSKNSALIPLAPLNLRPVP